jgi:hypothetical protein
MNFPIEIILFIFSFLDAKSLLIACVVCKKWNDIGSRDELWKPRLKELGYPLWIDKLKIAKAVPIRRILFLGGPIFEGLPDDYCARFGGKLVFEDVTQDEVRYFIKTLAWSTAKILKGVRILILSNFSQSEFSACEKVSFAGGKLYVDIFGEAIHPHIISGLITKPSTSQIRLTSVTIPCRLRLTDEYDIIFVACRENIAFSNLDKETCIFRVKY